MANFLRNCSTLNFTWMLLSVLVFSGQAHCQGRPASNPPCRTVQLNTSSYNDELRKLVCEHEEELVQAKELEARTWEKIKSLIFRRESPRDTRNRLIQSFANLLDQSDSMKKINAHFIGTEYQSARPKLMKGLRSGADLHDVMNDVCGLVTTRFAVAKKVLRCRLNLVLALGNTGDLEEVGLSNPTTIVTYLSKADQGRLREFREKDSRQLLFYDPKVSIAAVSDRTGPSNPPSYLSVEDCKRLPAECHIQNILKTARGE